jgi:PadR family transcriptional regulator AphA
VATDPGRQREIPTSAEAAVLGLLSLHEWSTYELAQQVQRSLRWFWPRADRAVYDVPKRLVAAGFATASKERTGRRPRTVYAITDEGRAGLREWLRERSAPPSYESEAELRIFFADAGSTADLLAVIDTVEHQAEARLRAIGALAAEQARGETPYPRRLGLNVVGLRGQVSRLLQTLAWARWAREEVADWPAPDRTGEWTPDAVLAGILDDIQAAIGPLETADPSP